MQPCAEGRIGNLRGQKQIDTVSHTVRVRVAVGTPEQDLCPNMPCPAVFTAADTKPDEEGGL